MSKSILPGVVLILPVVCWAGVDLPPGFEVAHITDNPDDYSYRPQINNCGEVVFSLRIDQSEPGEEIFLYDNGRLIRLTDDHVRDSAPDINDDGTVVWTVDQGNYDENHVVMRFRDGEMSTVGFGSSPRVNNLGHVAWKVFTPLPCAYPSDIFLYDGESIQQITDDGFSNQIVEINNHDQLTWTRADFCVDPWQSDVMLYSDGVVDSLTVDQIQPGASEINDAGQIVWWSRDPNDSHEFIELWEDDGDPVTIIDPGIGELGINNAGEIVFGRHREEDQEHQIWLYRDGELLQVTDNPFPNFAADINDGGEIVWEAKTYPEADVYYLRRIRTGEADFDGDVDLDDSAVFLNCMTGPGDYDHLCACRFLDLDHDRDVDMADYAIFQRAFTGEK